MILLKKFQNLLAILSILNTFSNPLISAEEINKKKAPIVITESTEYSIILAKHLTNIGAKMYTTYWCPKCYEQKKLFGTEAVKELNIIECAIDGEKSRRKLCKKKGIKAIPSWEINEVIILGIKSLEELAELSNFSNK